MQCDATLMSLELKHPYADVTENSVAYHPVIFEEAIASEVVNKLRQGGYTAYYNCKKKTIVVVLFQ